MTLTSIILLTNSPVTLRLVHAVITSLTQLKVILITMYCPVISKTQHFCPLRLCLKYPRVNPDQTAEVRAVVLIARAPYVKVKYFPTAKASSHIKEDCGPLHLRRGR